jgi:hypothetical protein
VKLKDFPVVEADDVHFELVTPANFALEALSDCRSFFSGIAAGHDFVASDFQDLIQWCVNVISKARVVLEQDYNAQSHGTTINAELGKLDRFIAAYNKIMSEKTPETEKKAYIRKNLDAALWEKILTDLISRSGPGQGTGAGNRKKSNEEIISGLAQSSSAVPEIIEAIGKITTELHAGADVSAMGRLNTISERLTVVIRSLQNADSALPGGFAGIKMENGGTISDELLGLTDIFKQIIEAFDKKDIVFLCDLFEYELTPKLQSLNAVISILMDKLKENFN